LRIAISNIAWDVSEDDAVAACLARHGIDAIDVAPTKYFADPAQAGADEIARVRGYWNNRGIEITGMQALMFGTQGLNLFGDEDVRQRMLAHLAAVCRVGAGLGATRLVFGSPKNRDRGSLSREAAETIAAAFFAKLGARASALGVTICLEPNPARYGANFLLTSAETARLVRRIDHPAIKMQLDSGAMTINGEDAERVIRENADIIGHIHASEPGLVVLGEGGCDHAVLARILGAALPRHIVSIEMQATRDEPHLAAIERALKAAIAAYRSPRERSAS